jgi:hypothetical protein
MRGRVANAFVGVILFLPQCVQAQGHGGSRSFSSSSGLARSYAPAPQISLAPSRNGRSTTTRPQFSLTFPPVTGSSLINPGEASCLLNPSYSSSPYCRQYYSGTPSLGFEPVYPAWFPTVGDEADEAPPPVVAPEEDPQLAAQAGNLTAEVEMMREDQLVHDIRATAPPEPAPVPEEKPPTTVLVYRDGHRTEIQDYAILGKTLWVFADQTTRQVRLADLDLAATERVNEDRGVDFATPTP